MPPHRVAACWAGRCAERRLAWPSLAGGLNAICCLVLDASRVGKRVAKVIIGVAMQCTASRLETLQTAPVRTH